MHDRAGDTERPNRIARRIADRHAQAADPQRFFLVVECVALVMRFTDILSECVLVGNAVLCAGNERVTAKDRLDLSFGQVGKHGLAAGCNVHGENFPRDGVFGRAAVAVNALQI